MDKNNSAIAIELRKLQAEELKHKGYTKSDIDVLQNIKELPKEMLELLLSNYVHQVAMYRKKYLDAVQEGFKDEMKRFLTNAWEVGTIDNAAYNRMLSDLERGDK